MTTKEQLHQLVDTLADEQADRALALLKAVSEPDLGTARSRPVPRSLGIGASGRADVSEHVDEFLAEGLGR